MPLREQERQGPQLLPCVPQPTYGRKTSTKQVLALTKVRVFSTPSILSSSPPSTLRTTPWHRGGMCQGSECWGSPWLQNQKGRIKGSHGHHPERAEPWQKGLSPDNRGRKNPLSIFFTDGASEAHREVTYLEPHRKAGSRTHCTLSTPPVRLPKG